MRIGIAAQNLLQAKKQESDIAALEIIREIRDANSSHEFFLFVKPGEGSVRLDEHDHFKIIEIPAHNSIEWEQRWLPRALKKYRIQLLHCLGSTAPLTLDIPCILTLHDIAHLEQVLTRQNWYPDLKNLYRRYLIPSIVKSSRRIITVSHYEKAQIEKKLPLAQGKVDVIYNAANSTFKVYHDQEQLGYVKRQYRLPKEFILCLGGRQPKHNLRNVLKAYELYVQQNPEPLALVIADISPKQLQEILEKTKQQALRKYIYLTGYVSHAFLPVIYNLATLFLYPSLRESFGMPLVEALACGTPVVTSNTSALPEIAGGAAYLVDPESPQAISQALQQLLSHPNALAYHAIKGLERIKAFSWKNASEEILSIYDELLYARAEIFLPNAELVLTAQELV